MRYLPIVSVAASVAFLVAAGGSSAQRSAGLTAGSATGKYIVVLKDTADVDAEIARLGVQASHRYYYALKGFAARLSVARVAALRVDSTVDFVGEDRKVVAVGTVPIKAGEIVPPGIRRIESAVGNQIQKKSRWKVAIIDTGVDLDHTDLNSENGRDCINAEPAQDDNGHGTHVAGTVGARNQGSGLVGVSPNTKVVAVKVLAADGSASIAHLICGIDWVRKKAAAKNIKVANMSLAVGGADDGNCGNTNGDALHRAVCALTAAGVSVVVAAANSSVNFASAVPAAYDEALTVTAMADTDGRPGALGPPCAAEQDDRYTSFSNFATPASADANHTVAAPGCGVLSTRLGGGNTGMHGTSMASPHVAGTVANCLGHKSAPGPCAGMTAAQIIQKIRADAAAKPLGYGFTGDPNHTPPPGRYYGFLVSDLGY